MLATQAHAPSRLSTVLMALGSALIWSTTPVIVKTGLHYLGPLTIAALRFTLGGLILLPFVLRENGGLAGLRACPRRLLGLAVLMGVVSHTIGDGLNYMGMASLPASTVGFLNILVPVIPVLIGVVWLRERPNAGQLAGALLVLAGCTGFLYPFKLEGGQPLGLVFVSLSLLAFGAYVVISRVTGKGGRLPTLTMTGVSMLAGGLALWGPVLAAEGLPRFTWQGALVVVWLALFNSITAFMFYNLALKHMTILETNAAQGLMPVASTALAVAVLGEPFGWAQAAAIVVVLGGIVLVQTARKDEELATEVTESSEERFTAKTRRTQRKREG